MSVNQILSYNLAVVTCSNLQAVSYFFFFLVVFFFCVDQSVLPFSGNVSNGHVTVQSLVVIKKNKKTQSYFVNS